ncbi:hypothetical protein M011DRAFT_477851 [Sporormia fimetaria CBS 119925]|uniref:Rhodopsin domain-containing protein n=1 Tax=Sporormia fimetaria CBS 119925 TaxID=1340428 RepID=A0A6A6V7W4_9PLEO|nr:hypothetical protein M011DRAFT_477851 [Sporormia fimetaria CBS 119925]
MTEVPIYVAEPPAGSVRHTINPPTLHHELIAVSVSTTVLAFIAVVLRIFTRVCVTRNGVYMNDYMIILAMIFSFVLLGCNFPHMQSGLGYHMWEVKVVDFSFDFQVWTLVGTIIYATSLAFTKLSILLFYLHLSPNKWFRICVWALVFVVVAYVTVYDLISIFGCKPIAATWDLTLAPQATCMDNLTKYMALSVLNIIIDVLTLVLPIPVIVGLQMATRQKISVIAVFATGIFVCAVAIQRTTLLKPLMVSTDYTWHAVEQFQWCFAEVNAAIVCACAPALKPFCTRYLPGLLGSKFHSYNRGDASYGKQGSGGAHISAGSHARQWSSKNKDFYEMRIRDEDEGSEEERESKKGEVGVCDDEARLWDGSAAVRKESSGDGVQVPGVRRMSAAAAPKKSMEAYFHSSVTGGRGGAQVERSAANGIQVTSETRVMYARC